MPSDPTVAMATSDRAQRREAAGIERVRHAGVVACLSSPRDTAGLAFTESECAGYHRSVGETGAKTKVVYTAITAGYDPLRPPAVVEDELDYVLFTDDPGVGPVGPWQPVLIDRRERNPRVTAKRYKLLPHRFLQGYDASLWLDASCEILSPIAALMDELGVRAEMAQFRHPERSCIYDEAAVVKAQGLERPGIVDIQMACYRARGYPPKSGLFVSGAIYRRHNDPQIRAAMEDWWRQIQLFGQRDQLSGSYVLWKHGVACIEIPGGQFEKPWFRWHKHLKLQSYLGSAAMLDELAWLRAAAAEAWEARQTAERELRREAVRIHAEIERAADALLPKDGAVGPKTVLVPAASAPAGAVPGGYLEAVERCAAHTFRLVGWSMLDPRDRESQLIVATDHRVRLQGVTTVERGDVAAAYRDPALLRSGFILLLEAEDPSAPFDDLQVFSSSGRHGLRKLERLWATQDGRPAAPADSAPAARPAGEGPR